MENIEQLRKVGARAGKLLTSLSKSIRQQKNELQLNEFYQVYSKASLYKLPKLSKGSVEYAVTEMENKGYIFNKKKSGNSMKYAMTLQNVIDLYNYREVPKYRDRYNKAFTIFVSNLKGGGSKTVSTASLAHALRAHPHLLFEDLRILAIDFDPQASLTMFLNHENSVGLVETTAAQAMLQNVSYEELISDFITPSIIPGVDVIPASIDDAFIAEGWRGLCEEHLPGQNIHSVLKKNIIDKLEYDYDFIFIDCGPHLDAFLKNCIGAADLMLTPLPPATVDFHSSLKFISSLPALIDGIEQEGHQCNLIGNIGFMSKILNKPDHKICHSQAKEVFGSDMLDMVLPRLDGFERCGETFDTVISANPATYDGSSEALKNAKMAAEDFAKAVFDRIEFIRSNGG
ncbi:ParA family chromosome partitioning protein [Buttiauxella gaviniae ATCC 51604]|uniref:ParA family chromosome partitioning protein n=1 Tax=Buttiauxella gaviniae ATCC 51604 TaxID=1354253 RepID=A0A1B7HK07_9ENTR|nr:AAA family ATPase [Buttiauxella gaviniae]OAT15938.1 ParA family chromosome partitioning protein [Buttiauxella gaviniae ATCC 51604]